MRITCKHCGGDHPVWECKRPATKSTVAKITSPDGTGLDNSTVGVGGSLRGSTPKLPVSETTAGKALPVDTNPGVGREGFPPFTSRPTCVTASDRRAGDKDDQPILGDVAQGIEQGTSKAKVAGSNPAVISNKRKVGRPKFITDLKAYKAMKQKEYRKKWKERANDTKLG